jgi:hypothetical protein
MREVVRIRVSGLLVQAQQLSGRRKHPNRKGVQKMGWEIILLVTCAFWIPALLYLIGMVVALLEKPHVHAYGAATETG